MFAIGYVGVGNGWFRPRTWPHAVWTYIIYRLPPLPPSSKIAAIHYKFMIFPNIWISGLPGPL
jgi:hypothetical protein